MDSKKFDEILNRRIDLTKLILSAKRKEYAGDELKLGYDRLHNFNRASSMLGCSREKALVGMLSKHLVSILDIVDNFENNSPSLEMIEEKNR
jgi:hypothetical protein